MNNYLCLRFNFSPHVFKQVDNGNEDKTDQMDQDDEMDQCNQEIQTNPNDNIEAKLDEIPAENAKSELKVSNVKSLKRVLYPFIIGNMCPICGQTYKTRKSAVSHYKFVHLKAAIKCTMCSLNFANADHLKEHWLLAHENAPWKDADDEQEVECSCYTVFLVFYFALNLGHS